MSAYKWKSGSFVNVSADVAGEVCSKLESKGMLTPKNLLNVSRDESAPLHKAFEWDDSVAAEAYREEQAGYIIRHLVVSAESEESKEPVTVRAFFKVDTPVYERIDAILTREDSTKALFERGMKELESFEMKYKCLQEFSRVVSEIDRLKSA